MFPKSHIKHVFRGKYSKDSLAYKSRSVLKGAWLKIKSAKARLANAFKFLKVVHHGKKASRILKMHKKNSYRPKY